MSKTSLHALYVYVALQDDDEINRSLYDSLTETYAKLSICIVTDHRWDVVQATSSQTTVDGFKYANYLLFCRSIDLKAVAQTLKDLLDTIEFDVVVLESDPLSFALGVELQRILNSWVVLTQVTEVIGERVVCVRKQGQQSEVFAARPHQLQLWQRTRHANSGIVSLSELEPLVVIDLQEAPGKTLSYQVDPSNDFTKGNSHLETLSDEEVVLVVGAGVKDSEGVDLAATVCATLGIGLGATRVVTDRGWLPYSHQVGTTGTTIAPKVYIAFGVSGAIQHLGGVEMPQHSIAVNVDAAAPIFGACSYVIQASAKETLGELELLLMEIRSSTRKSDS